MKNTLKYLLLISLLIAVVISENDFKGDGDSKRAVECKSSSNKHEIKSAGKFKAPGVELQNELDVTVEYNDNNIRAKLEYQSESQNNGTTMKSKQKFRMVFWEVFSFVPTTQNGYSGETKTTQFFVGSSTNSTVQPFDSTVNKCKLDNTTGVYTFKSVASLGTGLITITYNFAGTNFQSGTVTVPNNALKFSVNISSYPFPAGTDTQYVGMRMVMLSGSKVSQKVKAKVEGKDNDAIVTDSSSNAAWFAWLPTVVDENGNNVPVLTSPVSDANNFNGPLENGEASNQVYFTFAKSRPSLLFWDPQVGVQTATSSASLFGISALIIALVSVFLF